MNNELKNKLRLYLVTDRDVVGDRDLSQMVRRAVEGGVSMVQLREKNCDTRQFVELAKSLKTILSAYDVPLIINDRIDVALAVGADGVHIGQSDMPYDMARCLLGNKRIIGLSVETLAELEEANRLDVDYVAASPVFSTPTKTDTAAPWGVDGLRNFCRLSGHPVVAIGGMNENTIPEVMQAGADGVALVSAILSAEDPRDASVKLRNIIGKYEK